jgi:hypothetical protein
VVLVRVVRRRGLARAALPVVGILAYLGATAGAVALQDGPVSALYGYSQPGPAGRAPAVTPVSPEPTAEATSQATPTPDAVMEMPLEHRPLRAVQVRRPYVPWTPAPHPAGQSYIDTLVVGGRHVDAYIPAAYDASPTRAFPVLYFLHGYPGYGKQWEGSGAQLPGVLDQLIASGAMPPVIAVLPDGNGQVLSDAEWGDTPRGDRVEHRRPQRRRLRRGEHRHPPSRALPLGGQLLRVLRGPEGGLRVGHGAQQPGADREPADAGTADAPVHRRGRHGS